MSWRLNAVHPPGECHGRRRAQARPHWWCASWWCASIIRQAIRAGLVDELYLHVAPLVLGAGRPLFEPGGPSFGVEKLSRYRVTTRQPPAIPPAAWLRVSSGWLVPLRDRHWVHPMNDKDLSS